MPEPETARYERRDFDAHAVMRAAMWLVVALVVTFVALRIFESLLSGDRPVKASKIGVPGIGMPAPQLQANPAAELAELRAREDARLHGYGWVDREAGIIHIPIER